MPGPKIPKHKKRKKLLKRARAALHTLRGELGESERAAAEFHQLCRIRAQHLVPVREPLLLISQIQRSGGTLLSQLFDGHPQCHAHPHELLTGHPDKATWTVLDLAGEPQDWFDLLFEARTPRLFREGYSKYAEGRDADPELFPFPLPPLLQESLFLHCVGQRRPASQRDVFDCYFTSYFNAWLDNHNLTPGPKRLVTAFVPRLAMDLVQIARFLEAYPDGRLVSIVREPHGWYASARRHDPAYAELDAAIALWKASTQSALDAKLKHGDAVTLIGFGELLDDTESVMRRLASSLGLDFHEALLAPTFNGSPIKADSSFPVDAYGVLAAPLHRARSELSRAEAEQIDREAGELYQRALAASSE